MQDGEKGAARSLERLCGATVSGESTLPHPHAQCKTMPNHATLRWELKKGSSYRGAMAMGPATKAGVGAVPLVSTQSLGSSGGPCHVPVSRAPT